MTTQPHSFPTRKSLIILSRLLLPPEGDFALPVAPDLKRELLNLSRQEFDDLVTLANLNHVVIRGLDIFLSVMRESRDGMRAEWAASASNLSALESAGRFRFCIRSVRSLRGKFTESR